MHSPWGDITVVDSHVHFFSHGFFAALAGQAGKPLESLGGLTGWEVPGPDPAELATRWVRELDRHGVARAALIASLPGDHHSVAAAVASAPERFYGNFLLDPLAPDAAETARQAVENLDMRGICLFPAMHRYSVHDPRLRPIYELAAARPGVVVFVHCGVLTVGVRKKLGLPSPFDMRYSNPLDLHAMALEFPRARFVVPHFGAGYLREALMLADLCPNVFLDTSSSNSWIRYHAPELDLRAVFRRALDVAGPGRLLFGTDSSFFPRGWQSTIFDAQVRILRESGISAADAGRIFGGNLESLMKRT